MGITLFRQHKEGPNTCLVKGAAKFARNTIGDVGLFLIFYVIPRFASLFRDVPRDVTDEPGERIKKDLFSMENLNNGRIVSGRVRAVWAIHSRAVIDFAPRRRCKLPAPLLP
jgi:hypothetical protein